MNRDVREILGIFRLLQRDSHLNILRRALNASVVLCEQYTVMPPGFFLECELAYQVVSQRTALINAGLIILPRRELSLERLIEKKRIEYGSVRKKFEGLFDDKNLEIFSKSQPIFVKRKTKIGWEATKKWEDGPDDANRWNSLKSRLSGEAIENARRAPRILLENGEALTWEALKPHLNEEVLFNQEEIRLYLQRNYFTLYIDEFELVVLRDIPHILDEFFLPSLGAQYSFNYLSNALDVLRIGWLLDLVAPDLVSFKSNFKFIRFIDCFVQLAEISGSLTNFLTLLDEAKQAVKYPDQSNWIVPRLDESLNGVSVSSADRASCCDALGEVAEFLETKHDLYIRQTENPEERESTDSLFSPWRNDLVIRRSESHRRRLRKMKNIVIATANERETRAVIEVVKEHIANANEQPEFVGRNTNVPRWTCKLPTKHGVVTIAITQADETGGFEAVDLLRRSVKELNPDTVFFVGCAALLDEKETPVKNLVYLARRAIDSDKVELKPGERLYDMEQHHGDLIIRRNIINLLAGGCFDPIVLRTNRDFISGSAFLGDRNAERRSDLISQFPADAAILEMEAFHIYKELFRMRSEGDGPSISVIKGISDFGDDKAQINKWESQRIATKNAAKVVMILLHETAG
jgi:hypothetical protein